MDGWGEPAGHVFISYVREDSHRVDQLQRTLQAAGIPVWRDTAELWPGEDWRTKIRSAITDNALVFIACFSNASLGRSKSYQNQELRLAIEQLWLRRPDDPWLIPVRFDECEIPDWDIGGGRTLTSIQRADLFGDHSEGAERLIEAVLRILGQPTEVDRVHDLPESEHGKAGDGIVDEEPAANTRDSNAGRIGLEPRAADVNRASHAETPREPTAKSAPASRAGLNQAATAESQRSTQQVTNRVKDAAGPALFLGAAASLGVVLYAGANIIGAVIATSWLTTGHLGSGDSTAEAITTVIVFPGLILGIVIALQKLTPPKRRGRRIVMGLTWVAMTAAGLYVGLLALHVPVLGHFALLLRNWSVFRF